MATTFTDISGWIVKTWESSGKGTSPLMIVENPDTAEVFFFKEAHEKYETEFWSEVIASKYGQLLGLNVLDYNVANFQGRLGCLSKRMVDVENGESLYHGVEILNDHVDTFRLTKKPVFSYQDLETICERPDFKGFIKNIHKLILFDALIGNTDRHTENWAFIKNISVKLELSEDNPDKSMTISSRIWAKISRNQTPQSFLERSDNNPKITVNENYSFSPIYDSGCCLGREIQEEKLKDFINDSNRIESYIKRGKNEIRWHNENKGFFELVEILLDKERDSIKDTFQKISENYTNDKVNKLVIEIDDDVRRKIGETKLTLQRKQFIVKLLTARFDKLKTVIG